MALSLAWEWAHARLYTIWSEKGLGTIAFSIAHCTLGDLLIGASALCLALTLTRQGTVQAWSNLRIAVLSALIAALYTVFSEWLNVSILRSWSYADSMPKFAIGDFQLGLTPVAQWLVIPPASLYLARRASRRGSCSG